MFQVGDIYEYTKVVEPDKLGTWRVAEPWGGSSHVVMEPITARPARPPIRGDGKYMLNRSNFRFVASAAAVKTDAIIAELQPKVYDEQLKEGDICDYAAAISTDFYGTWKFVRKHNDTVSVATPVSARPPLYDAALDGTYRLWTHLLTKVPAAAQADAIIAQLL